MFRNEYFPLQTDRTDGGALNVQYKRVTCKQRCRYCFFFFFHSMGVGVCVSISIIEPCVFSTKRLQISHCCPSLSICF